VRAGITRQTVFCEMVLVLLAAKAWYDFSSRTTNHVVASVMIIILKLAGYAEVGGAPLGERYS
jgi:hypothetical protein